VGGRGRGDAAVISHRVGLRADLRVDQRNGRPTLRTSLSRFGFSRTPRYEWERFAVP